MKTLRTIAMTAIGTAIGRAVYDNREQIKNKLVELKTEIEKNRLQDQARAEALKEPVAEFKAAWAEMMQKIKEASEKGSESDEPKLRPVKDAPQA